MEAPNPDNLGPRLDFKFAFNDTTFSDRVLHIEIAEDSLNSDPEGFDSARSKKRKSETLDTEIPKVKTLPVNSAILAANSPFFYKLFKNGMRESQEGNDVTLRINESEELALMDVLNFMFSNPLSATTALDWLGLLIVADKFEVTPCVKYCIEQMLQKIPMSQEIALLCLELHSTLLVGEVVQPLIDAAKQFLVARYKYLVQCQEDAMALPLCAIEVVLGSDTLRVKSEDAIFDFIVRWARAHYPNEEERREILTKHLAHLVRFQHMSSSKLKEALCYVDFDQERVSKLVLDALFSKLEAPNRGPIARTYKDRPVKVVHFEYSRPRCVVYFDLKKEECAGLARSELFYLDDRCFLLIAGCVKNKQTMEDRFGLYVLMKNDNGPMDCTLECKLAAMKKPLEEFHNITKGYDSTPVHFGAFLAMATNKDMFRVPWSTFMAARSKYFIDDILHLRVQLTINNNSKA